MRAFCSGVHGAALNTIVTVQELRAGLPSYEVRAYTPALITCIDLMAHALSKSATGRMHVCLLLYCLCKCWWRPQADICEALSCGAEHGQLQQSQAVRVCLGIAACDVGGPLRTECGDISPLHAACAHGACVL